MVIHAIKDYVVPFIAVSTLFASLHSHAEIYSWVDASGQRHFSDEKPKQQQSEEIAIEPNLSGYPMVTAKKSAIQSNTDTATALPELTLYCTAWSRPCDDAKAFLKQQAIVFTLRDIEKSRNAKIAFTAIGGKNIPLFSYNNQIHRGFVESDFIRFYQAQNDSIKKHQQ